jgi:casein kinase II subunit alpha
VKVLGDQDLFDYLNKYGLFLPTEVKKLMGTTSYPKQPWENFISEKNKHLVNGDALDLLTKMLQMDKNLRITPKEAMQHKYFQPILSIVKEQELNG